MSFTNFKFLTALALGLLATCGAVLGRAHAQGSGSSHVNVPPGFHSVTATVNGTTLHYVRGGKGPAVILLHGFPEDWYEFRHVDLRGVGESSPSLSGYDVANLGPFQSMAGFELIMYGRFSGDH
jgi:hypothetical protein